MLSISAFSMPLCSNLISFSIPQKTGELCISWNSIVVLALVVKGSMCEVTMLLNFFCTSRIPRYKFKHYIVYRYKGISSHSSLVNDAFKILHEENPNILISLSCCNPRLVISNLFGVLAQNIFIMFVPQTAAS